MMLPFPDDYTTGVSYFEEEGRMDELMEFLASYVRVVHADRYYKNLLIKNRGSSYLDIITASDIAYVVSLIKNSDDVWLKRKTADGELVKSLYTSGKGIKRVYGVTTWKKSGKKFYRDVMDAWKTAFKRNHDDYKVLHKYWDKWIESRDGGRKFLLIDGSTKKTAHSVLATRSEELCAADDDSDKEEDDHEDFDYESDPEENTFILSNWDRKRGGRREWNNRNERDDDDSGDNNEDGVGGGSGEDSDDDGGEEDGQDNDDVEDSDDGDEGVTSLNEFGKSLEEEARAAGLDSNRSKSNKRKQSVEPAERVGTRSRR